MGSVWTPLSVNSFGLVGKQSVGNMAVEEHEKIQAEGKSNMEVLG